MNIGKRFGSIIVCFVVIVLAKNVPVVEQINQDDHCVSAITYPKWFFQPITSSQSVGFSLRDRSAQADAYDRFVAYKRMRTKGVVRFYSSGNLNSSQDSLYFYYDPNGTTIPESLLTPIDSFSVPKGNKIYLFTSDTSSTTTATTHQTLCDSEPWDSVTSPNRRFGEGVVKLGYYDHLSSWVKAESEAIRSLLKQIAFTVGSVAKDSSGVSNMTEVYRYEYDLEIKNIQVERRWCEFDSTGTGFVHVVVSSPIDSVSEWKNDSTGALSDSAIAAIKQPESPITTQPNDQELWEKYKRQEREKLNRRSPW